MLECEGTLRSQRHTITRSWRVLFSGHDTGWSDGPQTMLFQLVTLPGNVSIPQWYNTQINGQTLLIGARSDGNDYYYNPGTSPISMTTESGATITIQPGQTVGITPGGYTTTFVSGVNSLNGRLDDPNYDLDTWLVPLEG